MNPLRHLADRHGMVVCFALFIVLAGYYAFTTPLFEKPDEPQHYAAVQYIANGNGLPASASSAAPNELFRQQGAQQPPLYYLLAALATAWIDTRDLVNWIQPNPHRSYDAQVADYDNRNFFVHGRLESWPPRGVGLAVYLSRGLSALFGGLTVVFVYQITRLIQPESRPSALLAAALCGLNPQFLFISSAVSNDSLVACLSAATLFGLLRYAVHGFSWRSGLILGGLVALGGLAKSSGFFLLPWVLLAGNLYLWRSRSFALSLKFSVALGLTFALVAGWWFVRNFFLYGEWTGAFTALNIFGGRSEPQTPMALWDESLQVFRSYWGHFGWNNLPMDAAIYGGLAIFQAFALLGLGVYGVRCFKRRQPLAPMLILLGWALLIGGALWQWMRVVIAPHGRLLFPAISAIAVLSALGFEQLWSAWPRLRYARFSLMVCMFLMLSVFAPWRYIIPAYRTPTLLQASDIPATYTRTDATWNGQIVLRAYHLPPVLTPNQAFPVELCWQAISPPAINYSVFIHVVGPSDQILEQRDTFPALGNFPTTLWRVGDVFCDVYPMYPTQRVMSSDEVYVNIGLYDHVSGRRLSVSGAPNMTTGDHVRFGPINTQRVRATDTPVAYPSRVRFGDSITLLGYDLPQFTFHAGESLPLKLFWLSSTSLTEDYVVFVHLIDLQQKTWAQHDAQPERPTSTWMPNTLVMNEHTLSLPADTPPGIYEMRLGMVRQKGPRLRLSADTTRSDDPTRLMLTYIRVVTNH